jgi:hypothetical protein
LQKVKQVAAGNADGERSQDAGKAIAEVGKFTSWIPLSFGY